MNKIKQSFQSLLYLISRNLILSAIIIALIYTVGFYFNPVVAGVVLGLDMIILAIAMLISDSNSNEDYPSE